MRYAAIIEYDGSCYHGWQRQPGVSATIQQHVESALTQVANHKVEVYCCGRTDAGVHGLYQIFHFDTNAKRSDHSWVAGANTLLPKEIRIKEIKKMRDDFHARFDAEFRHYFYLINNAYQASAIFADYSLWHRHPLDVDLMQQAAQALHGEHDFSAFRAAECQANTPYRFIKFIRIYQHGDWITIHICGNAFLHHMVRNIVGSLLPIGDGRKGAEWMAELLLSKDRRRAGATASAQGLYFAGVEYPDIDALTGINFAGFPIILETQSNG